MSIKPIPSATPIADALSLGTVFRAAHNPAILGYPGRAFKEFEEDGMLIQRDVAVAMRDGVKMYVDIYRPAATADKLPVLIGWSPYGKHNGVKLEMIPGHDVNPQDISKHYVFEAADPLYWCRQGYAVVITDPRNSWGSEGDGLWRYFTAAEARDYYDLIEWAGALAWSNTKVGLIGQSYFAILQWMVAALKPPHLTCIAPWGGMTDPMRHLCRHGGIPNTGMTAGMNMLTGFAPQGKAEDWLESMLAHPFDDAYWADKRADLAAVTVPAYVVADWSDILVHTPGTMDGFSEISSEHKWLEINGRKKWERFVQPEHAERLRAFYDRFLKGIKNDVDSWPPVRLEVRERYKVGKMYDEQAWPLARASYRKLFLHGDGSAGFDAPAKSSTVSYEATTGQALFTLDVKEDTELTGFMKLRLWVEANGSDDMDLFVAVRKIDGEGAVVNFPFHTVFNNGEAALGLLRVSHRTTCPQRSTEARPVLTHDRELRLAPGDIVPVDISVLPSSTLFEKGSKLQVIVQGRDIVELDFTKPGTPGHQRVRNKGQHVLHLGAEHESYLLVPLIPTRA